MSLEKQLHKLLEAYSIDDIYKRLAKINDAELGNCPECGGTGLSFGPPYPCKYCGGSKNVWWNEISVKLPEEKS